MSVWIEETLVPRIFRALVAGKVPTPSTDAPKVRPDLNIRATRLSFGTSLPEADSGPETASAAVVNRCENTAAGPAPAKVTSSAQERLTKGLQAAEEILPSARYEEVLNELTETLQLKMTDHVEAEQKRYTNLKRRISGL